jgi:type IV secretion system protein VirB10
MNAPTSASPSAKRPRSLPEPGPEAKDAADAESEKIAGDRGIPSVNRVRSVQARASRMLAFTLMGIVGIGALGWYYTKALNRPAQRHAAAEAAARSKAQGDTPLPPLGPIAQPSIAQADAAAARGTTPAGESAASTVRTAAGTGSTPTPGPPYGASNPATPPPPNPYAPVVKTPAEIALERRLAGPAFAHASTPGSAGPALSASLGSAESAGRTADGLPAETPAGGGGPSSLEALLRPTLTPAVSASMLPTRRFLLGKGTFIDCTLETAIDSSLPGMTTCITATDTFSADGTVVLLERGTKLVGETRGEVQPGTARLFVLWSEARTPTGVVVPLSSPGTDALGRSGLEGAVNRHFWERFGAAILLTVINGTVQGLVNSQNNGGSVVVSPSTSTDVMSEVLKGTINIPPTITKSQGDRIQVFVARDVDFRSVYSLRSVGQASPPLAAGTPASNGPPSPSSTAP